MQMTEVLSKLSHRPISLSQPLPVSFLWLSNTSHLELSDPKKVVDICLRSGVDFLLHTGNFCKTYGESKSYLYSLRHGRRLRKPFYYVLGYHDYDHMSIQKSRDDYDASPSFQYNSCIWLQSVDYVALNEKSALVGVDGFSEEKLSPDMRHLANCDAERLADQLSKAKLQGFRDIHIATHAAPFLPSYAAYNRSSEAVSALCFCKATGVVIEKFAQDNPQITLTLYSEGSSSIILNNQPKDHLTVHLSSANFHSGQCREIIISPKPLSKKVIFLDIDGVLQPSGSTNRSNHDLNELKKNLSEKNPTYAIMDKHDIGAAYLDWHPTAIMHLKELCEENSASIVISSSWRQSKTLYELYLLLSFHGLHQYLIGKTEVFDFSSRGYEVETYLANHSSIEQFVILDDCKFDFSERFATTFVKCDHFYDEKQHKLAMSILSTDKNFRVVGDEYCRFLNIENNAEHQKDIHFNLACYSQIRVSRQISSISEIRELIFSAIEKNNHLLTLTISDLQCLVTEERHSNPELEKELKIIVMQQLSVAISKNASIRHLTIRCYDISDLSILIDACRKRSLLLESLDLAKTSPDEKTFEALIIWAKEIKSAFTLRLYENLSSNKYGELVDLLEDNQYIRLEVEGRNKKIKHFFDTDL